METEEDILALATKASEAVPQENSNSNIYAGAAFGVIAAITAGALIADRNRKQTSANEEPLL